MARTITVPVEYGYPTVTVWINDQRYDVETGKNVSVDNAVYLVLQKMMEKPVEPTAFPTEAYKIRIVKQTGSMIYSCDWGEFCQKLKSGCHCVVEYEDESLQSYDLKTVLLLPSSTATYDGSQCFTGCTWSNSLNEAVFVRAIISSTYASAYAYKITITSP